ncbi:MAG: TlpA family protein disulfide reductase [Bacteroidia bacterium]|nr:TlpA family protein disulfide reductase [Bacteroidia bacterium]
MRTSLLLLCLCIIGFGSVIAQDHYLVDLENRSPDAQALVQGYEGTPAILFKAKDYKGNEVALTELKGQEIIMWFWKLDCALCLKHLPVMNQLYKKHKDKVFFISFADDPKAALIDYTQSNPIDIPVIPNSSMLSQGPYGAELGYPKFFIVDKSGIIKWVIPEEEMRGEFDLFLFIEALINSL